MTELFLNVLSTSIAISIIVLLTYLFSLCFGRHFSSKCKFALWCIIILRLCIPIGDFGFTPILSFSIPESIVIHDRSNSMGDNTLPEPQTDALAESREDTPQINRDEIALPQIDVNIIKPPVDDVTKDNNDTSTTIMPEMEKSQIDNIEGKEQNIGDVADQGKVIKTISSGTLLKVTALIWFCGAVTYLAAVLVRYNVGFRSFRRSSTLHSADGHTEKVFRNIATDMKLRRPPRLMVCDEHISPILMGYTKPIVVIPSGNFDAKKLEYILRHELVHFKRGDLWLKLACTLARSIHWFNPLVYIASARCCTEMEMSCDEIVLRSSDEDGALSYGETMLEIAKNQITKNLYGFSTTFNSKQNAVKERVVHILDRRPKRRGVVIISVLIMLCILSSTFIGCNVLADKIVDVGTVDKVTDSVDNLTDGATPDERDNNTDTSTDGKENETVDNSYNDAPQSEVTESEPLYGEDCPETESADTSAPDDGTDFGDDIVTEVPQETVECFTCEAVYLYRDEPTHTEYGADHYVCYVCGKRWYEAIEKLPHNMTIGNCAEPSVCINCGYVGEINDIHDFAPATVNSPATCRRCGKTEGTVLTPVKIHITEGLGPHVSVGSHKTIGSVRYEYRIDEISYSIGELQPDGKYEVFLYHKGEKIYDNRPFVWLPQDSYGAVDAILMNDRAMFGVHVFNGIYCSFSKTLTSETYHDESRIDTVTKIYLYPGEYSLRTEGINYIVSDPAYGADPMATEFATRRAEKSNQSTSEYDHKLKNMIDDVYALCKK